MSIPTEIYTLFEITLPRTETRHLLLTRVERRAFANWDQDDEEAADEDAVNTESHLIKQFIEMKAGYPVPFEIRKLGELQGRPVGDRLAETDEPCEIDIWIAETSYGQPWVVLGTATREEEFWRLVYEDDDLHARKPLQPATRLRVYYMPVGGDESRV